MLIFLLICLNCELLWLSCACWVFNVLRTPLHIWTLSVALRVLRLYFSLSFVLDSAVDCVSVLNEFFIFLFIHYLFILFLSLYGLRGNFLLCDSCFCDIKLFLKRLLVYHMKPVVLLLQRYVLTSFILAIFSLMFINICHGFYSLNFSQFLYRGIYFP